MIIYVPHVKLNIYLHGYVTLQTGKNAVWLFKRKKWVDIFRNTNKNFLVFWAEDIRIYSKKNNEI